MANVLPFKRKSRARSEHPRWFSKVENVRSIRKSTLAEGRIHLRVLADEGVDVEALRPRTRADCADVPRPCPWVSCQHNLYLDINPDNGSIKFNFPDVEPEGVPANKSCALDVADLGGASLEDVASTMNLTRERTRQIEVAALQRLQRASRTKGRAAHVLGEYSEFRDESLAFRGNVNSSMAFAEPRPVRGEADEDGDDEEAPTRISFFAEGERADAHVCASVWNIYAKASNARGISCRSRGSLASSRTLARVRAARGELADLKKPTHVDEERSMSNETTLTTKEKATLAAYTSLKEKLGRVPTGPEIAAVTKFALGATRYQLKTLAEQGLAEIAPRGGGAGARGGSSKPRVPVAAPPPTVEKRPRRTRSSDPFVADLIAKRDALLDESRTCEKKAAALDKVIEQFSAAL